MSPIIDDRYMLPHVRHVFHALGKDNLWELHVTIDFPLSDNGKKLELANALLNIEPGRYERAEFHSQPLDG